MEKETLCFHIILLREQQLRAPRDRSKAEAANRVRGRFVFEERMHRVLKTHGLEVEGRSER